MTDTFYENEPSNQCIKVPREDLVAFFDIVIKYSVDNGLSVVATTKNNKVIGGFLAWDAALEPEEFN